MKALVTGGGGFLGRYIVDRLVSSGADVASFSRCANRDNLPTGVTPVQGDIADRKSVITACENVEIVYHTASRVGVWGDYDDYYQTNVVGTRNILAGCVEQGVPRLVYTSSPSVVFDGGAHEIIDETCPYPDSYLAHYPATKALAEKEIIEANGKDGLMTCSLRPHLIWGPGDTNLIPRLIKKAKSGRLAMVGDGSNMIDNIYVENAADAHLQAAARLEPGSPVCGSTYFITQGKPVNCWDWINSILTRLNLPAIKKKISYKTAYRLGAALELAYKTFRIQAEPPMTRFMAQQLAMSHYFSIEKAKRDFGYNPSIDMDEGMERLIASLTK